MTLVKDYSLSEEIVLSGTSGEVTATISSATAYWSDISGIRKGFRIILNGGVATLLEDPVFQSNVVNVNIVGDISGVTTYAPGEWQLRVPATRQIKEYFPRNIQNSLILPEYSDSLQTVSIDEIQDAIKRLRNIRRWNVMDEEYLDVFLQTMGMFFKSEQFDVETRRRFIKELPTFLQLNGTRFFINYLSFVIGADFNVTDLWSNDYKQFIKRDEIPSGNEEGWYQTNHVELEFDANFFGVLSVELIIEIFYILASAPLVLQRIIQNLTTDLNVEAVSQGGIQIWYTSQDLTPPAPPFDPQNIVDPLQFNQTNNSYQSDRFVAASNDEEDSLSIQQLETSPKNSTKFLFSIRREEDQLGLSQNLTYTNNGLIRYNNQLLAESDSMQLATGLVSPSPIVRI